ncbi:AAA family ATPase [Sodalis sp. RH19]|uniref:AAA family ATPase n=1 Tax=Sodalis sp. RH19 TaxID=3394334 RepID=UPI0039B384E6
MTDIRLKSLVIENFRSLRGKVVVPLDAQVVLVHGTNGMGKTSILSALELGLTGKIAHLAADGDAYRSYLTSLDTGGGSIALTSTSSQHEGGATEGSLVFSDKSFIADPLFGQGDAHFFAERCYLPQATLGRLLEIYDDQRTGSTSPLTLFVKELLGLDPLDALVDGLDPAFHVTRIRKIAPDYRRLEALKTSLQDQIDKTDRAFTNAADAAEDQRTRINEVLSKIAVDSPAIVVTEATDLAELRLALNTSYNQDQRLTDLSRMRSELRGLLERWQALPSEAASRDQANKERDDQVAIQKLAAWRSGTGAGLGRAVDTVREVFTDVPPLDEGPEKSRLDALSRAAAEVARCKALLKTHAAAAERVNKLNSVVQRATIRIEELNKDLAGAVQDAKSLANALAGIAPHISGEICPVCNRDFADQDAGPLAVNVAAKIASLTNEAGRLQALTTERAEESNRLAAAQRELLSAGNGKLSAEDLSEITVRKALMEDIVWQLRDLELSADEGTRLMVAATAARQMLILSRRRNELSISMLPEIETAVQGVVGQPASNFAGIDQALGEAMRLTEARSGDAERVAALCIEAQSLIARRIRDFEQLNALRAEHKHNAARMTNIEKALKEVETSRDQAKKVSEAANTVRSNIVKKVFSTSLNKVWRDLFVRLAPSEQFVPSFKLPTSAGGKVEAILETLHRSGKASGSPGAMLSQGNLNTAALTLFLALHLSVPVRMPWLILDDPVQSMDDVHIAQFAALLRTLSKGMDRQIIIAVHERALFDYLTLELSPAFPGDSLITVEITRNFEGDAVVTPRAFSFEKDRAIAA